MRESILKQGDIVTPNAKCFEDGELFQAHLPKIEFIRGKRYVVKERGLYGDGKCEHWRILVEGSSQFVHEDCFDLIKTHNMVEVEDMLKKLVNKDTVIKAVEDKKAMAEANAFAHFGNSCAH